MELLEKLKLLLGVVENDALLLAYLDIAKQKILDKLYPFDSTVTVLPERYKLKQVEIAQYLYNKRGAEGETSHSENGISRSYENADIPESLMRDVVSFVRVI
ncbi:MAG: phage head-tail connector protein [Oscillospiraceae bacterium]